MILYKYHKPLERYTLNRVKAFERCTKLASGQSVEYKPSQKKKGSPLVYRLGLPVDETSSRATAEHSKDRNALLQDGRKLQ